MSFALFFSVNGKSQCTANFSFAINSNGNVSFTDLSTGVSSGAYYAWDFGDNQYNYTASPSHIYGANGIYTITLWVSDSSTSCNSSVTQTLSISNVSCNLSSGFSYIITNGYVMFTNTSTGTYPGTSYVLSYGDATSNAFPSNSFNTWGHSYSASGSYTVTLTAQNSTACVSSYSTVISVTVPGCSLNAGFTYTVNSNGTVNFNNTTTGASGSANYYWNFGIGSSWMASPPTQTYSSTGQYTVILHVMDSVLTQCSDTYSAVISVNTTSCFVNAGFWVVKDSTITSSIVWNAYPNFPINTTNVLWSWGDGSSNTSLYPSHTYSAPGVYNICLSLTVSCGSSTTICMNSSIYRGNGNSLQVAYINVVDPNLITGIPVQSKTTELLVYPNPAKDQLTIEGNIPGATLVITDLLGKTVLTKVQNETNSVIDISNLSPGIYIVRSVGMNQTATTKIIKE